MNVNVLIDAIVRQTTVLIAQLATAAGTRAPLAHLANRVFMELVGELQAQGVGHKVIADMFGMALRTYYSRVQRLSEGATVPGRSLWEAVLEFLREHGPLSRSRVLERFHRDDEMVLRGVLADLVGSGLVYRSGRGDEISYRALSPEEMAAAAGESAAKLDSMVWITVQHDGAATREEMVQRLAVDEEKLAGSLGRLVAEGKLEADGERYVCPGVVIPVGDEAGWEAAVLDHYRAMVVSIGAKLALGQRRSAPQEHTGGATYSFELWPGHPYRERVLGQLAELRARSAALRAEVEAYNAESGVPDGELERVWLYLGQALVAPEAKEDDT